VDELTVSTVVYESPETIYEFLRDFPGYAQYSEHLQAVRTLQGDGGPGTRYALRFSWWKLTYTAHSEVTNVTPPTVIDWKIIKDIDAHGCWRIEPLDELPADAPAGAEHACTVILDVTFDPHSAESDALNLPRLVSIGWVIKKAVPLIRKEAERVFTSAVEDIEGERRSVSLDVTTNSDHLKR